MANPPPIAPNTFCALTFSAAPRNGAILGLGLVRLAIGGELYAIVLVPEKTGAALVVAGIGTRPILTACKVAVAIAGAPGTDPVTGLAGAGVFVMKVTCGTVT